MCSFQIEVRGFVMVELRVVAEQCLEPGFEVPSVDLARLQLVYKQNSKQVPISLHFQVQSPNMGHRDGS